MLSKMIGRGHVRARVCAQMGYCILMDELVRFELNDGPGFGFPDDATAKIKGLHGLSVARSRI